VLTDFGEVGVRGGFGGHRRVTVGEGERAKAQVMATVTDGEAVGVVFACLRVTSLAASRQDPVRGAPGMRAWRMQNLQIMLFKVVAPTHYLCKERTR
jgi:hypothetical protein